MASGMPEGLYGIGHDELKRNWRWFLALGIALIGLSLFALFWATLTTLVSVEVFGWLLVIGGALSLVHSFWRRRWGGFFVDMLAGVLYLVTGFMVASNPAAAALMLTLLMAMFFLIGGIFRIVIALSVPMHHWGWLLLSGIVTVLLGVLIWRQWPWSGLWVIGLFIGIDLFFYGWSLVMLALTVRDLPQSSG